MTETGHFRGSGNVVWELSLPLNEVMQEQLTKGYLLRVNADGSAYVEAAAGESEMSVDDAPAVEAPPPTSASKAHWVGYAHRVHGIPIDDAEAMTKNDLMERFGAQA
ncbi:hypothetical protein [Nonomuraea typhae]|uniref:hypothetical protein n=1 Tax=Nonomuraea typhae TaxID=2603600 RepID=UPI0012F9215F|nr:hypothetical protein [Nonomuraea typhae]